MALLCLVALCSAANACGANSGSGTAQPETTTSCVLITSTQARQILNRKVSASPRPKEPGECNYVTTKGAELIVDRFATAQALDFSRTFLKVHSTVPGTHIGTIDGTQTLWSPLFDGGRLDAIKGGNALTVWVGFGTRNPEEVANRAMAIVLPKV